MMNRHHKNKDDGEQDNNFIVMIFAIWIFGLIKLLFF